MTAYAPTLIAALLDRSGSMESIRSDAEGGFNAFIAQQAEQSGDVRVTLAQFDSEYEVVYQDRPISDVPEFRLQPRSMTALLDGIGRLVTSIEHQIGSLDPARRPERIIILVVTDGHENASQEWTKPAVHQLITRMQAQGWEFIFLGASLDAVDIAQAMGFRPSASMAYAPSPEGVGASYAAAADYASRIRTAKPGLPAPGFSNDERSRSAGRWSWRSTE